MPTYDYRCNHCGRKFALFYKSYKDYETSTSHICPHCQSTDVTRRISRVAIAQPTRDLSNLSSNDMLSVLDGGNSREVGKMFQQVADSTGENLGDNFNEATRRLTKGESIDKVERDLAAGGSTSSASDE
ncbi:MAG: FmdB family zinc ribbon protein [Chloroflexota bacterium]